MQRDDRSVENDQILKLPQLPFQLAGWLRKVGANVSNSELQHLTQCRCETIIKGRPNDFLSRGQLEISAELGDRATGAGAEAEDESPEECDRADLSFPADKAGGTGCSGYPFVGKAGV